MFLLIFLIKLRQKRWMTRSGSSWRLLPEIYGNWNSIYKRFNNWSKRGIWQQIFELCKAEPDLENLLIDSTLVRAHPCASGAKGEQGLGRSCGGYSTKIHATSDGLGNPLDLAITGGNCHDVVGAKLLLSEQKRGTDYCRPRL